MVDQLLTIEEVADRLNVHKNTVRKFIRLKEIRVTRLGAQWRIRPEWLEKFINDNETV